MGWKMTDADKAQIRKWADERRPRLQTCRADYDAVEQVLRLRDDSDLLSQLEIVSDKEISRQ